MSWSSDWPPRSIPSPPNAVSLSTITQGYDFLIQPWYACRERAVAAQIPGSDPYGKGLPYWPPPSRVWEFGIITDASDNTITDSTKTWDATGTFNNPWASVDVHFPDPPGSWDIIVLDCDYRHTLHLTINTIGINSVIVAESIQSKVSERVIPSIASLIGRPYKIIKRGGKWASDRVPEWPNSLVLLQGIMISADEVSITSTTGGWTVNQWAGKDVVFSDAIGLIDRGRISSNTASVLSFSTERSLFPAGVDFAIVEPDAMLEWSRTPQNANSTTPAPYRAWYRGPTLPWYSHYPNDSDSIQGGNGQSVSTTPKARLTMPVDSIFPDPKVFDTDYWTAPDATIGEPDDPKCPDIWKTLRQIQVFIERLADSQAFVDPTKTYAGLVNRPSGLTAAQLFHLAGINSQVSRTGTPITTGALAGSIHVSLSMPAGFGSANPISVYYAILDSDDVETVLAHGQATWQNGVLLGASFADTTATDPPEYLYVAKKIVVSLGWTRWLPREFLYIYDKTCWIPDFDEVRGRYIDPAEDLFPGTWTTRPKSTYFITHSALGFTQTSTDPRDQIDPGGSLGNGVVARWVDDNWNDPGINNGPQWFDGSADPNAVQIYNRFFAGKHQPAVQDQLDRQMSGTATGGDIYYLEDTAQDWWGKYWYAGGILHTESGTADGGSTLSLSDSSKVGSLWWDISRAHLKGAILEVTIGGVVYRRPITGNNGTILTWDYPLPATAIGKTYQIRLPQYEKNRFLRRVLQVTYADQTSTNRTIVNSDDKRLWVLPPLEKPIVAGTTYQIIEYVIGGCHERRNQSWIEPGGVDSRSARVGDGRPVLWLTDSRNNLPHMVKEYGRYMLGDYLLKTQLEELYWALNFLIYTIHDFGWTSRQDPAVAELNHRSNFRAAGVTFENCEADFSTDYVYDEFGLLTPGDPSDDEPPGNPIEGTFTGPIGLVPMTVNATHSSDLNWGEGDPTTMAIIRVYGYGSLTIGDGGYCPITSTTDFYVKTVAPFTDLSPTPILPDLVLSNRCSSIIDFYDNAGEHTDELIWTFDANGDTVSCSRFSIFSSVNADYPVSEGLIDRRSGRLGSNGSTPPARPRSVVNQGPLSVLAGDSSRGWEAVQWYAITRWAFSFMIPASQLPARPMAAAGSIRPGLDNEFMWFFQ